MSTTITYTDHTFITACAKYTNEGTADINNQLKEYYNKGYYLVGRIRIFPETQYNYTTFYATVAKPIKEKETL